MVLAGAVAVMFVVSELWREPLAAIGMEGASPWPAVLAGVVLMGAVTLINFAAIRKQVRRSFVG